MSEFEAGKTTTAKDPCDCGCAGCGDKATPAAVEAQPNGDRRKLLFGGVIATPAIVMLSSRSALATGGGGGGNGCTASANASVNLSKPPATGCKSLSPGCWKNTRNWPGSFKPGLPDPTKSGSSAWNAQFTVSDATLKTYFKDTARCTTNSSKLTTMVANFRAYNTQASMTGSYFSWATNQSFMQALWNGGGGNTAILRAAVAAILNAQQFGKTSFGYTVAELVAMVNSRIGTDSANLANDLAYLTSDRGGSCPQDGGGFNWCSLMNT